MTRKSTDNRFTTAGQALVSSEGSIEKTKGTMTKSGTRKRKDKAISAKVYAETWADFTAINEARGITNNSALNMLIMEYVRKEIDLIK